MHLKIENLVKNFSGVVALNDISFDVRSGELLAIIGPNGAGKSVLFGMISGLLKPTSGCVRYENDPISGLKPYQIARRGIARTFQTTTLFDRLRVIDNLLIGFHQSTAGKLWDAVLHTGRWKTDNGKAEARAIEVLHVIGLGNKVFNFVSSLTQLERKLLSIGIALMSHPKILLLDEPTGGLIQEDTDVITRLIREMNKSGLTICLIEHKMRMIMDLAERIIVLNYGTKIAEGKPGETASDPRVIEAYLGRKRNAET